MSEGRPPWMEEGDRRPGSSAQSPSPTTPHGSSEEQTPEPTAASGDSGCFGCFGILFAIFGACVVGGVLYVVFSDEVEYETIRMTGEVVVTSAEVCARRPELTIRPINLEDGPATTITYTGGPSPCRLPIDAEVTLSEAYTLSMEGAGSQTVQQSLIDTRGPDGERILEVNLRW